MGFRIDASALVIVKAGIKRLDTRDKFLHGNTWGFPISGVRSIAAISGGGGTTVNQTDVYNLGAAPIGHNYVYGACKFNLNNSDAGIAFNRWHTVMNGSLLWLMDGDPADGADVGANISVRQFVMYYFRISGGQVQLVRRIFISNSPGTYTVLAHSITYKLRTGVWN